jgi:hypothetical protein
MLAEDAMAECLVADCDREPTVTRPGVIRWAGMANYPVAIAACEIHERLLATDLLTISFDDAQPAAVDDDPPTA